MAPISPMIVALPLERLWDEGRILPLKRQGYFRQEDITSLLRLGPVRFVVANVGKPLVWLPLPESYHFWKSEVKPHLSDDPEGIRLEEFPSEYCYVASEWDGGDEIVVLLEVYH